MAPEDSTATALWITAPRKAELQAETLPGRGPGTVLVRMRYSGVSRGTERLVFEGRVPVGEHERMRAPFQDGDFRFPVKYGYAAVAEVEEGPPECRGRTVFLLHPHQTRAVVPEESVTVLPEGVPARRAVLAANMETALTVVWDGRVGPGDRVAVVGCGVVGLLVGHLASRIPGTAVTVVDVDPAKAAPAAALGLAFAPPDAVPTGCDVVVHASATGDGLATAIAAAGFEATVVEASWYGDADVPARLGGAFHSQRLRLVCSQVGHVPPDRRARFSAERRLITALGLLADDRLDALISGETAFSDAPAAYPGILASPTTLCHVFRY
ncbi:zinc-dependent alcohol dehydrogenase [Chthonobacter rhizosphaerae]|uniref:zinc-dependent alcohol dehydrogenase n=1 Tax=Chthonobacter rhizosphaerae TaxID=2735553 RepID=UPI0015EF2FAD|nr:zinc-binding alcohol dehydrogenase [Chthonobacter rhizosphaerae]